MGLFGKKSRDKHSKFCPSCGATLRLEDAFCTRCGYSFAERGKKMRKGIKWLNLIIIIIVLGIIYVGIQYSSGQPIIPNFITEMFNQTSVKK